VSTLTVITGGPGVVVVVRAGSSSDWDSSTGWGDSPVAGWLKELKASHVCVTAPASPEAGVATVGQRQALERIRPIAARLRLNIVRLLFIRTSKLA
jgi:hypothetical protein